MQPDFKVMETALRRDGVPSWVPLYEHSVDGEIVQAVMGYQPSDPTLTEEENHKEAWRRYIRFYADMGYDYVPIEVGPRFATRGTLLSDDTAELSHGSRGWVDEHHGPIQTAEDLENPEFWPEPDKLTDYAFFETICGLLPEGMKVIGGLSGGPFEHASFLMGLEPLSMAIYEDPEFVGRLFTKIGESLVVGAARLAALDGIGAYRFGDDLGYKTSTMLSPKALREYVFPWYAKVVEVTHNAGKPFVLHSCGQLSEVMDDIIATGVDAKHSYEDVITPVTDAKKLWGDRLAILGGIDVHFLCTASVEQIADRTKRTLDQCSIGGGYAMGSGNTIANYVPVENYLAMVKATHEWNGR